jgi:hypothetical protein
MTLTDPPQQSQTSMSILKTRLAGVTLQSLTDNSLSKSLASTQQQSCGRPIVDYSHTSLRLISQTSQRSLPVNNLEIRERCLAKNRYTW